MSFLKKCSSSVNEFLEFKWCIKRYSKLNKKVQNAISSSLICFMFLFIATEFPNGGVFIKKNTIELFWVIPIIFISVAVLMQKILDNGFVLNVGILKFFTLTSFGALLGLTYGSVSILNQWYITPEIPTWEPLFVATGLSTSGVFFCFKFYSKQLKKSNSEI